MPSQNFSKDVISQINKEKIKPTPGWVFQTQTVLIYVLIAIAFLVSGYLFSAIIFFVFYINIFDRENYVDVTLNNLPWQSVILLMILIFAILFLTRRLGTYYRFRKRFITLMLLIIASILAVLFYISDFHKNAEFSPVANFYYHNKGNFIGDGKTNYSIVRVNEIGDGVVLTTDEIGHLWLIEIRENVGINIEDIEVGEYLKVVGERQDNTITAELIRKINLCQTRLIKTPCQ